VEQQSSSELPEELCFRFAMATFARRQAEARMAGVRKGVHPIGLARQAVLDYLKADSEWAEAFAQIVILADRSADDAPPEKIEYAIYNPAGKRGKGRYVALGEVAAVIRPGSRVVALEAESERALTDDERAELNSALQVYGKATIE
jgi:hypothetical protein